MKITRKHPFTGQERTQEIAVTEEQLIAWKTGTKLQDAMPDLTVDEREFIKTGLLPEEFDAIFEDEDKD